MKAYALILIVFFLLAGCGSSDATDVAQDGSGQLFAVDGDYAGSHILIAYAGAERANPTVTRTKEEALARAQELIAELGKDLARFETLAEESSDGPSGPEGGNLGSWAKGQMVPEFDEAIDKLEVGAITQEPVETSFGYHIIRRNALKVPHFGADAFFVAFTGDPRIPETVTRNQAEAEAAANELKGTVNAGNFEEMANKHNDLGEGPVFLGVFKENDPVPPELMDAVKGLGFGEVAGPIPFPFGYAFVRRTELEQYSGAHILIGYAGAMRANPAVTRTKEEALAEANRLAEDLKQNPDLFAQYATENSDGPTGADGGDLGVWFKGAMVPEFDVAIESLKVGEITPAPVETPFGYHIIQRRAVPE